MPARHAQKLIAKALANGLLRGWFMGFPINILGGQPDSSGTSPTRLYSPIVIRARLTD